MTFKQAVQQFANVIMSDTTDKMTFQAIKSDSSKLSDLEQQGSEELVTFPPLLQDTYSALFKAAPQKSGEIPEEVKVNETILDQAMGTTEYKNLRTFTRLDEFSSAIAAEQVGREMLKNIPEEVKEKANEQAALQDQIQKLLEQLESLGDLHSQCQDEQQAAQFEQQIEQAQQQLGQAQQQAQQVGQQLQDGLEQAADGIRIAMRNVMKQAAEQAEEMEGMMKGWGTDPSGKESERMNLQQRIALAKQLMENPKLKKTAEQAGRLKNIAKALQRNKAAKVPTEIESITYGNDLEQVVPEELLLLDDPDTELLFYKKMIEGDLMQYELVGREKVGKGPIIYCLDQSGSMSGPEEIYGKAVLIVLAMIARMQKRDLAVVFYGAKGNVKSWRFPGAQISNEKMVELVTDFMCDGGTDFETPLSIASEIITESEFNKADVIFATDGVCDISDTFQAQFKQLKQQRQFKVIGVLLSPDSWGEEVLWKFCDDMVTIMEIAQAQKANEAIFSI